VKTFGKQAIEAERARRDAAWQRDSEVRQAQGLPPGNTMPTQRAFGVPPPAVSVTVTPAGGVPQPSVAVTVQPAVPGQLQAQPQPPSTFQALPQGQAPAQPQAQQQQIEYPPPPPGVSPEQWASILAQALVAQQQPAQPNMLPPGTPPQPTGWNPEMMGPPGPPVDQHFTVQVAPAAQVLQDVGVILSAHMRPQMTESQLVKVRQQSVQARRLVYVVSPGVPVNESLLSQQATARFSMAITPWWRFSIATMLDNEFVVILDDDTMPGGKWIEAALDHLKANPNDVVVARGVKLDESLGEQGVGPGNEPKETAEVDYGENGWVVRRDKLIDMLAQDVLDQNPYFGWSIHLGWAAKHMGGKTVVLPYTVETAGMLQGPARDAVSLRRSAIWAEKHYQIVRHYRNAGWQLSEGQPA
jgi:hypothetical protein